jgi:hypothetical protein
MANKNKITFSARKDPLLRHHPANQPNRHAADASDRPAADDATTSISRPGSRMRTPTSDRSPRAALAAVEEPVGVIAVPTPSAVSGQMAPTTTAHGDSVAASEPATPGERGERSRHSVRRVQTSMSLPPATWDTLDELGQASGVSAGELLVAILTGGMPDTPTAALAALEQLLVNSPPDEGPHEERNYRLPLGLRTQLDGLTKVLGPSVKRSLLIRALLAAHAPQSSDDARELITARRIHTMRTAMHASAAG